MSDTLFDLDAVAPVCKPEAPCSSNSSLVAAIAARATLPMKAASDTIGLWTQGRVLTPDDPILLGDFVNEYTLDRWMVANVALMSGGELLVRFQTEGDTALIPAARLAPDGSIIGFHGSRMIPAALIPERTNPSSGQVYLSDAMQVVRLLGSKGAWGLFESLGANNPAAFIGLLCNCVELPLSKWTADDITLPESVCQQLREMHLARLSTAVTEFQTSKLSAELIFSISAFLRSQRRNVRFCHQLTTSSDFDPDQAAILQPLLNLLSWSFAEGEWKGEVSVDASYGWRIDIELKGTHLITGAEAEADVSLLRNEKSFARWFDPVKRIKEAISALEATKASKAVIARTEDEPKKKQKGSKSVAPDAIESLGNAVTFLRQYADNETQSAALAHCVSVMDLPNPSETEIDEARVRLFLAFTTLSETITLQAGRLLQLRHWTNELVDRAEKLVRFADELGGFIRCYSDDLRSVRETIETRESLVRVISVAPGYWVAIDKDGASHGAVSSTGYYSLGGNLIGGGSTPAMDSLVSHLLEEPEHPKQIRKLTSTTTYPRTYIEWLKGLPCLPEQNAIRDAANYLSGISQVQSIRANLGRAVEMLAAGHATPDEARRVFDLLDHDSVADPRVWQIADIARELLELRFGPFKTRRGAEQRMLDDEESDDPVETPDDDEAEIVPES